MTKLMLLFCLDSLFLLLLLLLLFSLLFPSFLVLSKRET